LVRQNKGFGAVSRRGFLGSAIASAAVALGQKQARGGAPESEVYTSDSCTAKLGDPTEATLIGNVHALLPGAVAFIQNNKTGIVLDIGADRTGWPGSTAPDFSYSTWKFMVDGADLTLEWGKVAQDAAVFRIYTTRNVKLLMTLPANPWRLFYHYFSGVDGGLDAQAVTLEGEFVPWSLRVDPAPNVPTALFSTRASVEVQITPDHPVHLVAGFGELPSLESVDATLDAARARYRKNRAQANGSWGDFVAAITDNLNNNRLYSSLTKRMGNVIGRSGWLVSDSDYLPYFTWDSSFNGLLSSIEDPETAKETIRTVLRYQLPNGMVSQLSDWVGGAGGIVNMACSNPPVTSLCAWKLYQRWGDKQFLEEVYPRLLRWHDWWPKHSDGNQNGLLEWGSAAGGWKQSLLATGWDDTPHFNGSGFAGTQMTADAVDLNSLWSLDAETLSKMAAVLGRQEEAQRLRREHEQMNRLINEKLWNEELGLYCSRLWSEDGKPGVFLTRIVPLNFYPLLCGAPDQKRAQRVLATLTDPKKFWGTWMLPTLPYDDPEYSKQEYWKGHVWGPSNYLVWQGIQRYGSPRQKAEFARRSVDLFMRNWTARGTCNENYRSTDGTGDDHPHYTWGALLCQIGIEALYDIDADGRPVGLHNEALTENLELQNVPAGGNLYTISSVAGRVSVKPQTL
jgi:Glycosyl hydrolase family 63 C-terminal domain